MGWTTKIAGQQWTAADANYLGNRIIDSGTLATRPASGTQIGQHYEATDTLQEFRWNGTAWIVISEPWTAWTPVVLGANTGASANVYSCSIGTGALFKRDNGRVSLILAGAVITNTFAQTIINGPIIISNLPTPVTGGVGSIRITSGIDQVGIALSTGQYVSIAPGGAGGSLVNGQITGVRDNTGALMGGTLAAGNSIAFHFVGTTTT
jgi:hypothetical protein